MESIAAIERERRDRERLETDRERRGAPRVTGEDMRWAITLTISEELDGDEITALEVTLLGPLYFDGMWDWLIFPRDGAHANHIHRVIAARNVAHAHDVPWTVRDGVDIGQARRAGAPRRVDG